MHTIEFAPNEGALSFGVDLPVGYDEARRRTLAVLQEQGFGILTEIDVRATMKQKLGVQFRPYTILGACNPPLAYRALSADLEIGVLLPCNVVVYEIEVGQSRVEFMNPLTALGILGNEALQPVAREATERLERAARRLTEQTQTS